MADMGSCELSQIWKLRTKSGLSGRIRSPGPNGDVPISAGGLTGGTVIPSGNPLDVPRRDNQAVKRRAATSGIREGKPWSLKPGQRMLFSLGRRIYERETRTRKPAPKSDVQSQWRTMEVQRS